MLKIKRDNSFYVKGKYKFNMVLDLESLKDQLSNEYIVILRVHYLVSENINLTEYMSFAYDFSDYNDIRELYLISDILITDYSSVFLIMSV
ncbi:CDP-glycerol glycerophosphotransferase family protein [Bacillus sp. FSL M8-0025]|uniref:CDP-glycerol glycerophosphotransferase family protein n=1 Tax=Bacillus sp. FSL M8-0025 TaxID=2921564 RepID=UPI0030D05EF9